MTRIVYKKRFESQPNEDSAMILEEINGTGLDKVAIEICGLDGGYVRIGDERATLKCGVANMKLSSLNDGLYTPIYTCGSHSLICSPIIKRQGMIARPTPDGKDISRLELLISSLCERISLLEDELKALGGRLGEQSSVTL